MFLIYNNSGWLSAGSKRATQRFTAGKCKGFHANNKTRQIRNRKSRQGCEGSTGSKNLVSPDTKWDAQNGYNIRHAKNHRPRAFDRDDQEIFCGFLNQPT
jgi:hypothetical protein